MKAKEELFDFFNVKEYEKQMEEKERQIEKWIKIGTWIIYFLLIDILAALAYFFHTVAAGQDLI